MVVVDCEIAVTWMRLDHSELHWLAAPRAGVVDKNGQRHGEFLFAPGELRTLKGVQPIDCEDLGRFAAAPQSTPTMRARRFHVQRPSTLRGAAGSGGLVTAAVGTILGAAFLLGRIAIGDWLTALIGAASLAILFRWKVSNPLRNARSATLTASLSTGPWDAA
jgi:hypothetical protein